MTIGLTMPSRIKLCLNGILFACLGAFAMPAQAALVIFDGEVSYEITHDSGFVDGLNQPIADTVNSLDRFGGLVRPMGDGGPGMGYGSPSTPITLNEIVSSGPAGFSTAQGMAGLIAPLHHPVPVRPVLHGLTRVTQVNPNDSATDAARLHFAYDANFGVSVDENLFPDGTSFFLPMHIWIQGFVGDGPGAYIQFEAKIHFTFTDSDGQIIGDTQTLGFGGSNPITDGLLNGGGRIDREMLEIINVHDGVVPLFHAGNFGSASVTPWQLQPVSPFSEQNMIDVPVDAVALHVSGFFELSAKNDGSPSGILAADQQNDVPEPATLTLMAAATLLALRRRPPRR